ncbi:carboxylesterase family protein [Gordonia oryzae]|uniref:carboxylesterase family protein n=1 Tax=Gordonia oryzae TaxID=2487349 RepID=UPI001FEC336A|nr:carboxylesterase family protein [Gordonia oryzae]
MSDTRADGGSWSPVVETTSSAYRGVRDHWIHVCKGVWYAAPAVGENRWRRSRSATPHAGVADADRVGAECAQARHPAIGLGGDPIMDEDYRFLNVWAPVAGAESPRPVIV